MSFPSNPKQFRKIHFFQSSLLSLKFVAFLAILFYSNLVSAAEVTLAWDANTEPDLAGYMIYYGFTSRSYDWVVDVGDQTTYTVSSQLIFPIKSHVIFPGNEVRLSKV
jgi:hypothetical protein